MTFLIAILLLLVYGGFLAFILRGIANGKFYYLLIYIVVFLPVYSVFLSFLYEQTESILLIRILQYSKELVVIFTLSVWVFGQKSRRLFHSIRPSNLDWCFVLFGALSFVFFILPIGDATFIGKATYLKNILLLLLAYFFGRNVTISSEQFKNVSKVIFAMSVLAFLIVVAEKLFGVHFHSVIGFSKYHLDFNNIEPQGNFGLNWTFEAQGGQPRYGSFYSNPLEFAASLLISFSLSIIYIISMKHKGNQFKYLTLLGLTLVCLMLAYSRATMVSFVGVLFIIALLLNYYKVVIYTIVGVMLIVVYIFFFAPDDTRYFVEDTITFQNSSSITHVIEWAEGVQSMVDNPLGIGLAMSGNAGGVEDDLKVSGENQFLIYGVQLGLIGMLLYLLIFIIGVIHAWKAFRMLKSREDQVIPLVAICVKFGLILPLLTANVEAYLYVSLFSWWLIGASETLYAKEKLKGVKTKLSLIN